MNAFFQRRERPRLPAELATMGLEEYAAILRDARWSEKAIRNELGRLEQFQLMVGARRPRVDIAPEEAEDNRFAASVMRRRSRKREEPESDDHEE